MLQERVFEGLDMYHFHAETLVPFPNMYYF